MEELGGMPFDGVSHAVRKKRSQTSRRPRPDSQSLGERYDPSSLSSTPPSDDVSKGSHDENTGHETSSKQKEFNLNQCISKASSITGTESEKFHKRSYKEDGGFSTFYNSDPRRSESNNKHSSEGVLAPANWRSTSKERESGSSDIYGGRNGESQSSVDGIANENKVKKVKLKVGGVTRTIHANGSGNGAPGAGSSTKSSPLIDDPRPWPKQNVQGSHSPQDKRSSLQGIPWKNFSKGGFSLGKADSSMGRTSGKNNSGKQGDLSGPARKSKRVPKKRVLDEEFGEDDEDDEIRYLEKLKTSRVAVGYKEDGEEGGKKQRKLSKISNVESSGTSRSVKDGKKSRSERNFEDTDYEVEELVSESEFEGKKKKKQKKESVEPLMDGRREMTLTTRQRALQSSKDAPGSSLIEFPNGLPPAPPRKQKEKLSEVEQQLKKAEAAQRRRMQVEKAARESEAEAIRKILGQDSNRKKREEKIKKRQEELAQKKAANALMLQSNTIRTTTGPTGTVVTFPKEMGLPSIFDSKPISYPPPREKCAGPSCTNPFKYRDSKSKYPLCSLQCYKAVQKQSQAESSS